MLAQRPKLGQGLVNRHDRRLAGQLDQAHFDRQLGIGGLVDLFLGPQQQAEQTLDVFERACGGLVLDRADFMVGQVAQHGRVGAHLDDDQMVKMLQQIATQPTRIVAVLVQIAGDAQHRSRVVGQDGLDNLEQNVTVGYPERLTDGLGVDLTVTPGDNLLKQRLGIPQTAVRLTRDQGQADLVAGKAFVLGQGAQLAEQVPQRNPFEIVALAARHNRGQNFLDLGGGKDELDVVRRLLQGFQQGVKGLIRQHVDFVDDDHPKAALGRAVLHPLGNVADVVDPGMRGAVNFQHVD